MSERGDKYQGKPCKRGHSGTRYRTSGGCVDCSRAAGAKRAEQKQQKAAPTPAG